MTLTATQRKNWFASCLRAGGMATNAIIGVLCNAQTENGGSWSPTQLQYGMGADFEAGCGVGILQWSDYPTNQEIYDTVSKMSVADGLKYEATWLLDHPSMWNEAYDSYGFDSFEGFVKNRPRASWRACSMAFTECWEQPADRYGQATARLANYPLVMPITWESVPGSSSGSSSSSGSGGGIGQMPTMSDCTKLLNKFQPWGIESGGSSGGSSTMADGFDEKACIDWFNAHQAELTYSMSYRADILTNGRYSDCSAFVSYMLELGWKLTTRALYTTETLHAFLRSLGYHCVAQGDYGPNRDGIGAPEDAGDVYLYGHIGESLGAAGHVVISLDGSGIWECQGAASPALRYTKNWRAALEWDFYGETVYMYHYSKK